MLWKNVQFFAIRKPSVWNTFGHEVCSDVSFLNRRTKVLEWIYEVLLLSNRKLSCRVVWFAGTVCLVATRVLVLL